MSGWAGSGDPQAVGGQEVIGERVPERMGLGLDQTANWEKTEAVVLAVGVDPLDALAQSIDGLARFARHAFPPLPQAGGLLLSLANAPRQRGRLDVVPFLRRRRIDARPYPPRERSAQGCLSLVA